MKVLVCPLSKVEDLVVEHRPARVISMLDPDRTFPELGDDYSGRHLRLRFHDITLPAPDRVMPATEHIQEFLGFLDDWDETDVLLIHCRAGISRSTAAAYIAACYLHPDRDEHEIALELRRASALARPNGTLVRLADEVMGRQGRMTLAIEETGRGLEWMEIAEAEPFLLQIASKHQTEDAH